MSGRIAAIDALQRGVANVWRNWQVVPLQVTQTLAVSVLFLAGLVPLIFAVGWGFVRELWGGWQGRWEPGASSQLLERLTSAWGPLLLAGLIALVVWTMAMIVYCWFHGGLLGTLAAADTGDGPVVASYSWERFRSDCGRWCWPIFWMVNLWLAIGTVLLCGLFALVALTLVVLGDSYPVLFGLLGCVGVVTCFGAMLGLAIVLNVALARLVTSDLGVLGSCQAALGIALRRLPGLLLIMLLFFVASMALGMAMLPFNMAINSVARDLWQVLTVNSGLTLVQWFLSGAIGLGLAGTLIAIVRGESPASQELVEPAVETGWLES